MQSLMRDKVRISDEQLLNSFNAHQKIHTMNLRRYEKLYQDYENHLRQDLQRQKAELQNSEVVENLLIKIKKQIFDQLKQLQSLQHQQKNGLGSQQQNEEQKRKEQIEIDKKDNGLLQKIMELSNNMHIDSQNYQRDQSQRANAEELSHLRVEVERYKQMYLQINQRLDQQMVNYQFQFKDVEKITQIKPHLLKKKLEAVLINKNLQTQIRQKQPEKSIVFFEKKQLQLKLLIKGKQIQQYRNQIEHTLKRLRSLQSQMAKLEIQSRQVKQLRNQNSILKMRIFGLENAQSIPTEIPQMNQNLPQLVKSQIFNFKNKQFPKQQQKKQNYLNNYNYLLIEQQQQNKLKEDMIRQNLAVSLKHYKKKYSELQKRYNEKESQFKTFIEKTKQKINDYNALIQKLNFQLQKSYVQISERSEKSLMIEAYKNWQSKIEAVSNKNTLLNKQMAQMHELFNKEKLKWQNQRKSSKIEIQRFNKQNNELKTSVRQFKNQMLQQQLSLDVWKAQNQNITNSQKVKSIQSLNQQIALLRSQFEQKSDLLMKEISKNERLKQINENLSNQLQQYKSQTLRLQQKNNQIQSKLTQSNRFSEQLQNTKEKLELEELSTQNLQKKLAHYINETKEYQQRVKELQEALNMLAHQNEQKNMQIVRINRENSQLAIRIQKLQEQFDIFEQKGSSLKKIQYFNRSSELQSEVNTLKMEYSELLNILNIKQHEIEHLKSECDRYIQQNMRYLKVIRQKSLQIDQDFLNEEKKYQQQRNNRIKQLQQKIHNLVQDNELLKNLVDQMRSKLNEKTIPSSAGFASKHQDQIYELRNALLIAENAIQNYKNKIVELQERCNTQKSVFKDQWNKLIAQYNDRSKSQKSSQQNLNEYAKLQNKNNVYLSECNKLLTRELQQKQQEIVLLKKALQKYNRDKNQKYFETFDTQKVPEYYRELISLRQEVQKLKQQRFYIQDKVRQLQQENSSLKIKLISTNKYQSPTQLIYPPNMGTAQIIANVESKSSFKSGQMDSVISSLKTSQRQVQTLKQPETDNFKNLVYLAPLVESVRGEESFSRLSKESK